MNWLQLYEITACGSLALCCVIFNASLHNTGKLARVAVALLGVSAIIRTGALIAKYAGIESVERSVSAAADGNIPLLTAVVLVSIVWQRMRAIDDTGNSSDAR